MAHLQAAPHPPNWRPEHRSLVKTMNGVLEWNSPRSATSLNNLNGRVVLVRSSRDPHNPPTGIRGWIEVHEEPGAMPEVRISVEFPQMFSSRAHHRTISLDTAALERLLASERNGAYEFMVDDELD